MSRLSRKGGTPGPPICLIPIIARGDRRQAIVHSDSDREVFADLLAGACDLAKFRTYAWVLMNNHYHSVFETPKANMVESVEPPPTPGLRREMGQPD